MKGSLLTLHLSPYIATFIIVLVGSGAVLAVLRTLDMTAEYAAYYPGS